MTDNNLKFIEGVGWRCETKHSMLRRMQDHDYHERCIYMITIVVKYRSPLLGELKWTAADASDAHIVSSTLGLEVERCWFAIKQYYPDVEPIRVQLMPDHLHGLLFMKRNQEAHLGQIIKGFKIGCSKAWWALCPTSCNSLNKTSLFESGYQDSILMGKNQLEHMNRYMTDNPRRLAIKRMNPNLFKIIDNIMVAGINCAAIGNRWLLERPLRMQVYCHNSTTNENLMLINRQKSYFLECAKTGAVLVSPCISAGEKEIARAALDAKLPLIVILENGFPPMYKPPGKYFEACAEGLLLMLAPWPYHFDRRNISRQQCLALNDMAIKISTEPWTKEIEETLM